MGSAVGFFWLTFVGCLVALHWRSWARGALSDGHRSHRVLAMTQHLALDPKPAAVGLDPKPPADKAAAVAPKDLLDVISILK